MIIQIPFSGVMNCLSGVALSSEGGSFSELIWQGLFKCRNRTDSPLFAADLTGELAKASLLNLNFHGRSYFQSGKL